MVDVESTNLTVEYDGASGRNASVSSSKIVFESIPKIARISI